MGTEERTSKMLKEVVPGPKGEKGSRVRSEWNTDVPSSLWVVTTTRALAERALVGLMMDWVMELISSVFFFLRY